MSNFCKNVVKSNDGLLLSILHKIMTFMRYITLDYLLKCLCIKCLCCYRSIRKGKKYEQIKCRRAVQIFKPFHIDLYVLFCLVLSLFAFKYAYNASCWPSFYGLLDVMVCEKQKYVFYGFLVYLWAFYRLYDLSRFYIDWILVRGNIKSPARSLLLFSFNIAEASCLVTILHIIFNKSDRPSVWDTFIAMVRVEEPCALEGFAFYIDLFRFIFGFVWVLIMVAGLVSQLVRSKRSPHATQRNAGNKNADPS